MHAAAAAKVLGGWQVKFMHACIRKSKRRRTQIRNTANVRRHRLNATQLALFPCRPRSFASGLLRNETNGAVSALITAGSGLVFARAGLDYAPRALAVTLFCRPASDAAYLDLFSRAGENSALGGQSAVDVRALAG